MKKKFYPLLIITLLFSAKIVLAACTITGSAINFGNYNGQGGSLNGTPVTVTVNCTPGSYNGLLHVVLNAGDSNTVKYMYSGANRLAYNVFTNNAYQIPFISTPVTLPSPTFIYNLTLYPQILNQPSVPAGTYTTTLNFSYDSL